MKDIRDYSLLAHNTFGIDAKCKRFLEYSSVEEAQLIVAGLTAADQPLLILGGGSNLLLTGDYQGTVLHSAIKGIEVLENRDLAAAEHNDALLNPDWVFLNCGSGEVFDDVVAYAVEHDFYGAENLSIIPGEVGASAIQNIGAYGVEAKDIIYNILCLYSVGTDILDSTCSNFARNNAQILGTIKVMLNRIGNHIIKNLAATTVQEHPIRIQQGIIMLSSSQVAILKHLNALDGRMEHCALIIACKQEITAPAQDEQRLIGSRKPSHNQLCLFYR